MINMEAAHKPKISFSSKLVAASVTAIVVYTAIMIWLTLINIANGTNIWPPTELTALWYAFWTVEIVSLATIKVSKVRNKYEKEETTTIETTMEPDSEGNMREVTRTIKEVK